MNLGWGGHNAGTARVSGPRAADATSDRGLRGAATAGVRPAAGFTLLELVVVLTLVGILVAMGIPAMQRSFAKSALRDAAGQLRTALAQARLEAIESGVVQTFRYQADTGRYVIEAHPTPSSDEEGPAPAEQDTVDDADMQELPDGVVFLDPDDDEALPVAEEDRSSGDSSKRIQVVDADAIRAPLTEKSRSEWSRPIVFFPTGRSSNARFRLLGRRNLWIELELRGLTGAVSLGEVQRPPTKEELDKQREEKREDQPREEQTPESPAQPSETPTQPPELPAPPPETPPSALPGAEMPAPAAPPLTEEATQGAAQERQP